MYVLAFAKKDMRSASIAYLHCGMTRVMELMLQIFLSICRAYIDFFFCPFKKPVLCHHTQEGNGSGLAPVATAQP